MNFLTVKEVLISDRAEEDEGEVTDDIGEEENIQRTKNLGHASCHVIQKERLKMI